MTCVWNAGAGGGAPPPPRASELAGSAVRLAMANYRALLLAVSVVLVPSLVVGATALGYWRSVSYSSSPHRLLGSVAEVVGLAVVLLGGFLAQAAGVHAATSAYVGARPDWRRSCAAATQRWRDVASTGIVVGVLSTIGLALFVVPGVVVWSTWFVAMPVVVMEGTRTREALRRSTYLMIGRRFTVLVAYLLVELLVLACSLPVGAIVGAAFAHSALAEVVAEQVAVYVVEILLTPLQVALVLVVYLDGRLRRDAVAATEVARAVGIVPHATSSAGGASAPWAPPSAGWPRPVYGAPPSGAPHQGAPGGPAKEPPAEGAAGGAAQPGRGTPSLPSPGSSSPDAGDATWPGISPKPPPPTRRVSPRPGSPGASGPMPGERTPPATDPPVAGERGDETAGEGGEPGR